MKRSSVTLVGVIFHSMADHDFVLAVGDAASIVMAQTLTVN